MIGTKLAGLERVYYTYRFITQIKPFCDQVLILHMDMHVPYLFIHRMHNGPGSSFVFRAIHGTDPHHHLNRCGTHNINHDDI